MHLKRRFPLCFILLSILWIFSGCSFVQEVQKWTGNRIEIIDDVTMTIDDEGLQRKDSFQQDEKDQITQSPKAHQRLDKILQDEGRGKYAGDRFDKQKVNEALNLLPKGLSEEKIYAYLLGLVGENYYQETDLLDQIAHTNYQRQFLYYQPKPPKKKKSVVLKTKTQQPTKKVNVVLLLDTSSSMNDQIKGKPKFSWVKQSIVNFAKQLPEGTSFILRTYGHPSERKKVSCVPSEKKLSIQVNKKNIHSKQLVQVMNQVNSNGSTLSTAIENAFQDLKNATKNPETKNMIFVISDNTKSCGKDPIQSAKKVHQSNVNAEIHTIGLDLETKEEKELRDIAKVSHGNFDVATNQKELNHILRMHTEDISRLNEPWQMKATDKITRSFASDKLQLHKNVKKFSEKVEQEHERLDEANQYIKDQNKIDEEDWNKLDHLIDDRKNKVQQYAEIRLKQIDAKLNQEYEHQTNQLKKSWSKDGHQPKDLENRKKKRLKTVNESQNNKNQHEKKQE